MNIFAVGYAEVAVSFVQVGAPWRIRTTLAGSNWWYWTVPLPLAVFTTLVGHSGYRMSRYTFHLLIFPVVALTWKHMLTPGDRCVQ